MAASDDRERQYYDGRLEGVNAMWLVVASANLDAIRAVCSGRPRKERVRPSRPGSYGCATGRAEFLARRRATHFESGDREHVRSDARRFARCLVGEGVRRVVGIGSTFEARRSFTDRSGIGLVVEGIDAREFCAVSAGVATTIGCRLDLTPLEAATPGSSAGRARTRSRALKPEEVLARRLAAGVESAPVGALPGGVTNARRARGSVLHDFYNGIGRVFVRIARELSVGVPRAVQRHRELVRNMALDIPNVRPDVIDARRVDTAAPSDQVRTSARRPTCRRATHA